MERVIPLGIHEDTYQWLKQHLNRSMTRITPEQMIREMVSNHLKLLMQNSPDSPYSVAMQSAQPYSEVSIVEVPQTAGETK